MRIRDTGHAARQQWNSRPSEKPPKRTSLRKISRTHVPHCIGRDAMPMLFHSMGAVMKHKILFGICLLAALSLRAAELRESRLVQVVNEVKVAPPQAAEKDAKANDI